MNSKRVYLYKDEENEIVLTEDNFTSVVVQLVRKVNTLAPNSSGELVNIRKEWVLLQSVVNTDEENIRAKVKEKIEITFVELEKIKKKDSIVDGILNDYLSQNQKLNEEPKW